MSSDELTYTSVGRTHRGAVRPLNEDSFLDRGGIGLWVVADGMGGHKAGDFASQSIVEELARVSKPANGTAFLDDVQTVLRNVNRLLYEKGSAISDEMTMGSTVVALTVCDGSLNAVWAGDSRLYRLRNHEIQMLTRDHSHVQELVEQGQITQEDAEKHPMRNVITRAVGADQEIRLDTHQEEISPGDRFFLCTDGVSNVISDDEIKTFIDGDEMEDVAEKIVSTCLERGAPDNLSFIIVMADTGSPSTSPPKAKPRSWLSRLIKN